MKQSHPLLKRYDRRSILHSIDVFIFSEVIARLKGELPPQTDLALRRRTMRKYLGSSVAYIGEAHACYMMRSRLGWFVKGLPHNSRFRESIKRVASQVEAEALIDAYFEFLKKMPIIFAWPNSPP